MDILTELLIQAFALQIARAYQAGNIQEVSRIQSELEGNYGKPATHYIGELAATLILSKSSTGAR